MSLIDSTLRGGVRRPGVHPPGRECVEPCCITILCTYDPGPKCFLHAALDEGNPIREPVFLPGLDQVPVGVAIA